MKKTTTLVALFLAIILILSGCKSSSDNLSSNDNKNKIIVNNREDGVMTLLYSSSDTFNPYTAATESNRQLCKLLYEPLIKLDNNFNVTNVLAENITLDGKSCTVTIKNSVFSDGSNVTAEDVAYSFNLAKNSATEYGYKLYVATSATVKDSKTVVFSLNKADPYFINVLDFPIIKRESEKRTDSDSVILPPIGGGRYKLADTNDKLLINTTSNKSADKYFFKEIRLIAAPDSESLSHYVEIGASDIYYSDIADGKIVRMSGEKVNININHLVYIGINLSNKTLSQSEVRQALSSGLDRTVICRDGFYNNALPATGFYNPVWEPVKSVQNIEITANKEITIENLEKIGYNSLDKNGIRKTKGGSKLKFNLLVNRENQLKVSVANQIASKLSEYGISIHVVEKSYNDYVADLTAGKFELYLAETEITPNMDLTNLLVEGGTAAYGIKNSENTTQDTEEEKDEMQENKSDILTSAKLVEGLYNGNNTVTDIASVLQTEMPFIPVCYRTGVLFYNDNIENVKNSSASDIYFSIDSYKLK